MSSNINVNVPVEGNPTTASVRQNFVYAKQEIEALQDGQTSVTDLTINQLTVVSSAQFLGKVSGTAAQFSSTVSAASFHGDGSNLTNVNAVFASSATNATNAVSATFAASATNATNATNATFASSATNATSAVNATNVVGGIVSASSLVVSGQVSGSSATFSANVCASVFYGDGSNLTNLPPSPPATSATVFTVNQLTVVSGASFTGKVSGTAAEFSGVVSALEVVAPNGSFSTKVSTSALVVSGIVSGNSGVFSGTVSVNEVDASIGSFSGNVSVAGDLNVVGSANGGRFFQLRNTDTSSGSFAQSYLQTDAGFLVQFLATSAGGGQSQIRSTGRGGMIVYSTNSATVALGSSNLERLRIIPEGQVQVLTTMVVSGAISGSTATFSGAVSASEFAAPTGSFSTKVSASALVVSGVVSGNSGTFSGVLSANELAAPTGSFSTKVSSAALVVSGVVSGSTATFSGAVCATSFFGSGSGLTGLSAGLTILASAVASAAASIEFNSILTVTYDEYWMLGMGIQPSTNNASIRLQYSTDNGSTWKTTSYESTYGAFTQVSVISGEKITTGITVAYNLESTSPYAGGFIAQIGNVNSTTQGKFTRVHAGVYDRTVGTAPAVGAGVWTAAASVVNAVRLVPSTGTIDKGTFRLYGVQK